MLDKKQKYLQVALNSDLREARSIISQLPNDKRIILEAGTPLIKEYGASVIAEIITAWQMKSLGLKRPGFFNPGYPFAPEIFGKFIQPETRPLRRINLAGLPKPYVVADLKCMDRGEREVEIAKRFGASAAVALGHAPIETLNAFIANCQRLKIDSMIDMLNVDFPLSILRGLDVLPQAVIVHRGVDEEEQNKEKEIPFHEIARIKNECDILVAVAGGDTFEEVRRALFNDADIAVVWKSFYKSSHDTAEIAQKFLKEIR